MADRKGEEDTSGGNFYRTERYVEINSSWYFLIRGGRQQGPFTSRWHAELSLQSYLSASNPRRPGRRHRDRLKVQQLNSVGKSTLSGHPPIKPKRIAFTAVASDVHKVSVQNDRCANDGNDPG